MKKILPPVLFLLFIMTMGLIWWGMGFPQNMPYPYNLIGLPFVAAGLILAAAGKMLFKKLNTNIMTFKEPDKLVTCGVFKYTRNPMYLGFVIAMMGIALLMGAPISSILLTTLFLLIVDRWYIAFEEKAMRSKFDFEYEEYCRKVRRWI